VPLPAVIRTSHSQFASCAVPLRPPPIFQHHRRTSQGLPRGEHVIKDKLPTVPFGRTYTFPPLVFRELNAPGTHKTPLTRPNSFVLPVPRIRHEVRVPSAHFYVPLLTRPFRVPSQIVLQTPSTNLNSYLIPSVDSSFTLTPSHRMSGDRCRSFTFHAEQVPV